MSQELKTKNVINPEPGNALSKALLPTSTQEACVLSGGSEVVRCSAT